VDVLMLEELTAPEAAALERAGLGALLPYHSAWPRARYAGTGVWSRFALQDAASDALTTNVQVTASVDVGGEVVHLVALHMPGPLPVATDWVRNMALLRRELRSLGTTGSILVGGDFNATSDTALYRRLLGDGFADATDQAGAGLQPTYPADVGPGPLIGIDHVITRRAVATSVHTVAIPGSDHRALAVVVRIPR
jgi:endonuclease/exonuclease/phosphatase (EEP) superfamily protein YafD